MSKLLKFNPETWVEIILKKTTELRKLLERFEKEYKKELKKTTNKPP